jgi:citronellol/citronellal dehydrogenase
VVAAKSVEEDARIPGTIYTAAREIAACGTEVLPVQCNVRDADSVRAAARSALDHFGRMDAVINNAGALWWRPMDETPMKRFDLVMEVNARGAYAVTEAFLPTMKAQQGGHVIMMSPPVDLSVVPGHIAYCISKFGMTMIALGLADEMRPCGIRASALWPKTVIESFATLNFGLGDPRYWRKADILADAVLEILNHPDLSNGRALIDEDFLREVGYTDFSRYNCVEGGTPLALDSELMRVARS